LNEKRNFTANQRAKMSASVQLRECSEPVY